MAEDRRLPGWPTRRLVKEVRSQLWRYGVRPQPTPWQATWHWASAIATSYIHTRWPLPSEIASQYMLLLLAEMKENYSLRLPYRASTMIPDDVLRLLPHDPLPLIEELVAKRKRTPTRTKQGGEIKPDRCVATDADVAKATPLESLKPMP